MENNLVIYIPSESKAASHLSMKRLLGVPLFLRGILTLEDAGFNKVTLIAPVSERRHILKAWEHHAKKKNVTPHFIWIPASQKFNLKSFEDLFRTSEETITFINANLLLTKNVLEPWKQLKLQKGHHLKAVIDRGLPPILRITKSDLKIMTPSVKKEPKTIEDILFTVLKKTEPHTASKEWSEPVRLVTRFTKKRYATKFLTENIRRSTPQWIARNINKRISLPTSVLLAKMRVSPNTITVFNMLVGMGASIGAAGRTYVGLLIGAILFQAASIIDGCDGEVAKLTHKCTKFGQYIDSISDNFALAGFFTGLMIHVYRVNNHTPWAFIWGALLLLGLVLIFTFMIRFLKRNTDSASLVTFDKEYLQKLPKTYPKFILLFIKYGKYFLKKDFFSFLILVLAIIGILPAMFYIAIIGVWVGNLVLIYLNLNSSRRSKILSLSKDSNNKITLRASPNGESRSNI